MQLTHYHIKSNKNVSKKYCFESINQREVAVR